ncbi:MAG: hypothetical protein H0T78_10455 [Longispora sp.]|nr:hypothetical protein [Longispora sp. (in: high G+C Gram-positive bacteria)]
MREAVGGVFRLMDSGHAPLKINLWAAAVSCLYVLAEAFLLLNVLGLFTLAWREEPSKFGHTGRK